jgi:hypothetical protein
MARDKYLDTWPRIADFLDKSERWCRAMSRRERRPLPAAKFGGIVRILESDLARWQREELADPAGPPPHAPPKREPGAPTPNKTYISVTSKTRDALNAAAKRDGKVIRQSNDDIINAMLDAAGAK